MTSIQIAENPSEANRDKKTACIGLGIPRRIRRNTAIFCHIGRSSRIPMSVTTRCGIGLPGQRPIRVYARNPKVHPACDSNTKGEIRTPEGLAAHQISSLARLTGLRYLSGARIVRSRKYLLPSFIGREAAATHRTRSR